MERRHAIIVIKNKDGNYLQYYDEIWESYLFVNCKIDDENDLESIKNNIYNNYNITIKDIKLVMDKIHSKYSQKDKIIKEYHHYFYTAKLEENYQNDKYKYFSYDELLNDKRVQEVNSDIVDFIKEL